MPRRNPCRLSSVAEAVHRMFAVAAALTIAGVVAVVVAAGGWKRANQSSGWPNPACEEKVPESEDTHVKSRGSMHVKEV